MALTPWHPQFESGKRPALRPVTCSVIVGLAAAAVLASPPESREGAAGGVPPKASPLSLVPAAKEVDQPNPAEYRRLRAVRRFREQLEAQLAASGTAEVELAAQGLDLARSGTDRVLVILVEFGGTDTFTWVAGQSTWDPLGKSDENEVVKDASGNVIVGDCSKIITATQTFTYSGPLHNRIERPRSAADRSGDMIWVPDFSKQYYEDIIFGNGVRFSYTRQDGSVVDENFTGRSVNDYYQDHSAGRYRILGDVVGWLQVPHSTWWYGADVCPGRRTAGTSSVASAGAIPGAGNQRTLVIDALNAVKAAYPSFDWAKYDQDGDGVIDRLWIIHAGLGEEDSTTLLNRTDYGESALWSHSSSLSPAYEVVPGIKAGPYIMMPENAGIGVLAHEYGHNLGADDLYAYNGGDTSTGFWSLMADDWTGYPIGFLPPALDPWHLDGWGWLDPLVITDPTRTYTVTLGQASQTPAGTLRGVKIRLPDGRIPVPVAPNGSFQWWGGKDKLLNSRMLTRTPLAIPAAGATLSFKAAWDIEAQWDFAWVQVSADGGATWATLANAHTTCTHDPNWIGQYYGFPSDLCAAGIGGFTGRSAAWPATQPESFSLAPWAGRNVLLRLWYMTDWSSEGEGFFVDDILVTSGSTTLLSDNAESGDAKWRYEDGWERIDTARQYTHSLYLQWRNVSSGGGYDAALADSRWRYGPADTGLLVWYNNNLYSDNEVWDHKTDWPGFGPKGRMLVLEAHPEPFRSPNLLAAGYPNEGANMPHRGQMRDAAFSLWKGSDFTWNGESFAGRPAKSVFDDVFTTYPGAEYVSRGPGYDPPVYIWVTKQWDASAVPPARSHIGIAAPGYTANTEFRFRCSPSSSGRLSCYWLGSGVGLGYDGGSGHPGDAGAAYGWKVEILSQSVSQAQIKISNSAGSCSLTCDAQVPAAALTGVPVPFFGQATAARCSGAPTFSWDFGDGATAAVAATPHTFTQPGTYHWRFESTAGGRYCRRLGELVVTANSGFAYLVPSVAHASGTGGSQWRTNVAAVNPGTRAASLTLTFSQYESGGTPVVRTATLGAGATVEWQDILVSLFGFAASARVKGTVRIDADLPLVVTSRTYNQTASGTYGQYYPALTTAHALAPGQLGVLAQVKRTTAFRANVGIQAVGPDPATVTLRARNAAGTPSGTPVTRTVQAGRYWQADDFFGPSYANTGDQPIASVTAEVTAGTAWVYASVVDNATGDPTTLPVLPVTSPGPYLIPSVAHASGTGGSQWRTNVAAVNPGTRAASLTLTFSQYESGGTPVVRTATLGAGATVEWQDILVSLFGFAASARVKGTVRIDADLPLVVTSRTYNQTASGTYGQYYPALTTAHALAPGQLGVLAQVKRTTAFRANVGIQAVGPDPATVTLRARNAAGTPSGTPVTRTVQAGRYWQADDFFGPSYANTGDQPIASVTAEVTAGTAWVYASVVDNATGDPTTLPVLVPGW